MPSLIYQVKTICVWLISEPEAKPEYYRRWRTLPNYITFSGIAGNLIHTVLLFTRFLSSWWTLLFTVFGGLTDVLDGLVARLTGQRSKVGEAADPFLDIHIFLNQILQLGLLGGFSLFWHPAVLVTAVAEMLIIFMGCSGYIASHHLAGKIRRAVHVGLFFLIISSYYEDFPWPSPTLRDAAFWLSTNIGLTFWVMAAASIVALACYWKCSIALARFRKASAVVASIFF